MRGQYHAGFDNTTPLDKQSAFTKIAVQFEPLIAFEHFNLCFREGFVQNQRGFIGRIVQFWLIVLDVEDCSELLLLLLLFFTLRLYPLVLHLTFNLLRQFELQVDFFSRTFFRTCIVFQFYLLIVLLQIGFRSVSFAAILPSWFFICRVELDFLGVFLHFAYKFVDLLRFLGAAGGQEVPFARRNNQTEVIVFVR